MTNPTILVASGPSARGFVPPDDVPIIAVNQAIDYLPRCDHWFTLDPSTANLKTMRNPKPGTTYWCALDESHSKRKQIPGHVNILTRLRQQHPRPKRTIGPDYTMHRLQARLNLATEPGYISTGNSAWGALGLAYHLGAQKVMLIGVDATHNPKLDGHRCRTELDHLPRLFASATGQIKMVCAGAMVAPGIPNVTVDEGLKWLRGRNGYD